MSKFSRFYIFLHSHQLYQLFGHWKLLVRFYHRVNSNEGGQIDKHILRKEREHRELEALRREAREAGSNQRAVDVCAFRSRSMHWQGLRFVLTQRSDVRRA